MQILTVGHSNHSIDKFLTLLKQHGVTTIVDVRSSPFSRYSPHFNQASLKSSLSHENISYVFLGEQLGARPKNLECYVEGKARYELIAATEAFSTGLERIYKGAENYQIALMCAEQDPITCHRAILVCKHLKNAGIGINHILKNGDLEAHERLEHRLLKLHNLSDRLPSSATSHQLSESETQLRLFDLDTFSPNISSEISIDNHSSTEELVEQAYQLQGEKIAYVEKPKNIYQTHE
jgi:hypothetical protein